MSQHISDAGAGNGPFEVVLPPTYDVRDFDWVAFHHARIDRIIVDPKCAPNGAYVRPIQERACSAS